MNDLINREAVLKWAVPVKDMRGERIEAVPARYIREAEAVTPDGGGVIHCFDCRYSRLLELTKELICMETFDENGIHPVRMRGDYCSRGKRKKH